MDLTALADWMDGVGLGSGTVEDAVRLTGGQIRDAFMRANPGVRHDGVYIKTVDDNRLMDVRLCYDLKYRPSACHGGLGAPDETVVRITPRRPR